MSIGMMKMGVDWEKMTEYRFNEYRFNEYRFNEYRFNN